MLIVLTLFTSIVANADPAIAELAERGQLRAFVEYPKSSCFFGVFLNSDRSYRLTLDVRDGNGPRHEPLPQIDELLARPLDRDSLANLANHYERAGQLANARACERMAIALCRQRLRTHPEDVDTMAALGRLLAYPRTIVEAEKWLRLGVATRPRHWRAWQQLSWHYVGRACSELTGQKPGEPMRLRECDFDTFFTTFSERQPELDFATRQRAIGFCQKARDCLDMAVIVAPEVFEVRACRFIVSQFLMPIAQILLADATDAERQERIVELIRRDTWADDIRKMAELSPDPLGYGLAFFMDLMRGSVGTSLKEANSVFQNSDARRFYQTGRRRLQAMSQSADPEVRLNALRTLTLFEAAVMKDAKAALAIFQRIPFDGRDRLYYELAKLIHTFMDEGDEVVRFFTRWLQANDEPLAYFDLANTLHHTGRTHDARVWLHKGAAKHPREFYLALAVLTDYVGRRDDRCLEEVPNWVQRTRLLHVEQGIVHSLFSGACVVPVMGTLPRLPQRDLDRFRISSRLLAQCIAVHLGLIGQPKEGAEFARSAFFMSPNDCGNALQIMNQLSAMAQRRTLKSDRILPLPTCLNDLDAPR